MKQNNQLFLIWSLSLQVIINNAAPVFTTEGGTGVSTNPTANSIVLGNSTSALAFQFFTGSGSSSGQVMTSAGGASAPTWTTNGWPGKVSGTFIQAGTSSPTSNNPSGTILIGTATPASITNSAVDNIGIGYVSLLNITSGSQNVGIGRSALAGITTGSNCVAIGFSTLNNSTNASSCIAIGQSALTSNNAAMTNITATTAIGYQCFQTGAGNNSVALGYQALFTATDGSNTYDNHVALGGLALSAGVAGPANTAAGVAALNNASGANAASQCTALGVAAIQSTRIGSNHVCLGRLVGSTFTSNVTNNLLIGNAAIPSTTTTSNHIVLGLTSMTAAFLYGVFGVTVAGGIGVLINSSGVLGTTTSSIKYKKCIKQLENSEIYQKIMQLWPVQFFYRHDHDHRKQYGLIAQQVKNIFPELIVYNMNGTTQGIQYHKFTGLLIAALQEQHEKINILEQKLKKLLSAQCS